jgi:peroxiredoxin
VATIGILHMPDQPSIGQIDFDAVRCLDISFAEKLEAYVQRHWKHQRPVALLYQELVDRLVESGAGQNAPREGDELIPFMLPDSVGQVVSSDTLLAKGPLVISFNRGSWCPFCRFELLAFAQNYPEIRMLGAEVISIIPEKATSTQALRGTYELPFPVLSDIDNGYSLANGLMISCGDALFQALLERGIDLATLQGNIGLFMPITATFVVGQNGKIAKAYVNPDFRKRLPPDQALTALKNL